MLVELQTDWFAPKVDSEGNPVTQMRPKDTIMPASGALYKASHNPHEIGDEYLDFLPSSAKILEPAAKKAKA